MLRGCDVDVGSSRRRLYFARPLAGAPRIRRDEGTAIADALTSKSSELSQLLGGPVGAASELGSMVGAILAIPGEFSDQKLGIKNGDLVREHLERHQGE